MVRSVIVWSGQQARPAEKRGNKRMASARRKRLGFLPGWRIFSYVIIAFNLLMLVWLVTGVSSVAHQSCDPALSAQACTAAKQLGGGIGAALIIGLWVAGEVILGVLWLVTRPRGRMCPGCGTNANKGVTVCQDCGHSFVAAVAPPAPAI